MFDINAQLLINGVKGIKAARQQIAKEFSSLNVPVTLQISTKTIKGVNELNSELNKLAKNLNRVDGSALSAQAALDRLAGSVANLKSRITASTVSNKGNVESVKEIAKASKEAQTQIESFGKAAAQSVRKYAAFTIVTGLFYGLGKSITDAISSAYEFEKEMYRLSQVTGLTINQLAPLKNTINDLSRELGISGNELINIAKIFAQAGQTAKEVKFSLEAIAKSSLTPTFGDMEDTAEGLIAALSQFNIKASESERVLSILNDVSKAFATESEDLISVIRRAGGVFSSATNGTKEPIEDLSELLALFTAVRSTTRESAETIATGLRTIFTRIQRGSTIKFLEQFDIQLADSQNNFIGVYEAFEELDKGLNRLIATGDDIKLSKVIEEVAGVRQISKIIPLIKSFTKAEQARQVALGASVKLDGDVAIAQQSISQAFARTEEKFNALIRRFTESREFQVLVRDSIALTDAILDIGEALEPVLPLLLSFATIKLTSGAFNFSKAFIDEFKVAQKALHTVADGQEAGATQTKTQVTASALAASVKPLVNELRNLSRAINQNTAAINGLIRLPLFKGDGTLPTAITNNRARTGARRGRRSGGRMYSSGGMTDGGIPVALTPGELVFSPEATKRIGVGNLQYMNSTGDSSVLSGMGRNGIGIVPGSGNTDSFHTTLPEGSFVIRKAFSDTRLASNKIRKYADGGSVDDDVNRIFTEKEDPIETTKQLVKVVGSITRKLDKGLQAKLKENLRTLEVVDKIYTIDGSSPRGSYYRGEGAIEISRSEGAGKIVTAHEVGHAVDNNLAKEKPDGSRYYSSHDSGTFQNLITGLVQPAVKDAIYRYSFKALQAKGKSVIESTLGANKYTDYRSSNREIFADMFSFASDDMRKAITSTTDIYEGLLNISKSVNAGEKIYGGLQNTRLIKVFSENVELLKRQRKTFRDNLSNLISQGSLGIEQAINIIETRAEEVRKRTASAGGKKPPKPPEAPPTAPEPPDDPNKPKVIGTGVILHPTKGTMGSEETGKYKKPETGIILHPTQGTLYPRPTDKYKRGSEVQGPPLPPGPPITPIIPNEPSGAGASNPVATISTNNIGALTALYFNLRTMYEAAKDGNASLSEFAAQIASLSFVLSQVDFTELKQIAGSLGKNPKSLGTLIKNNPIMSIIVGQAGGAALGGLTGSNALGTFVGNSFSVGAGLAGIGVPAPLAAGVGLGVGTVTAVDAGLRQANEKKLADFTQILSASMEDAVKSVEIFQKELAVGANNVKGITESLKKAFDDTYDSVLALQNAVTQSQRNQLNFTGSATGALRSGFNFLTSSREGDTLFSNITAKLSDFREFVEEPFRDINVGDGRFTLPKNNRLTSEFQAGAFNTFKQTIGSFGNEFAELQRTSGATLAGLQLTGNAQKTSSIRDLAKNKDIENLLIGIVQGDLASAVKDLETKKLKKEIDDVQFGEGAIAIGQILQSKDINSIIKNVDALNKILGEKAIDIDNNATILASALTATTTTFIDNIDSLSTSVVRLGNTLETSLSGFSDNISAITRRTSGDFGLSGAAGNPFADLALNKNIISGVVSNLGGNFGLTSEQTGDIASISKLIANEVAVVRDVVGILERDPRGIEGITDAFETAMSRNGFTQGESNDLLSSPLFESFLAEMRSTLTQRQGSGPITEVGFLRDQLTNKLSLITTPANEQLLSGTAKLVEVQNSYINSLLEARTIVVEINRQRRSVELSAIQSLQNFNKGLNAAYGLQNNANANLSTILNSIGTFTSADDLLSSRRSIIDSIDQTRRSLGISESQTQQEQFLTRSALSLEQVKSLTNALVQQKNALDINTEQLEILAQDTSRLEETNMNLLKIQDERAASRLDLARAVLNPDSVREDRRLRSNVETILSGGSIGSRDAARILENPQQLNAVLDGLGYVGDELVQLSDRIQATLQVDLIRGFGTSAFGEKYAVNRFGVGATTIGSTDEEMRLKATAETIISTAETVKRELFESLIPGAAIGLEKSLNELTVQFGIATEQFALNTKNMQALLTNNAFENPAPLVPRGFLPPSEQPMGYNPSGMRINRYQSGGLVGGYGSGDKVPSLLEPGEFVLNRNAVANIGANRLNNFNNKYARFQSGGQVRRQPSANFSFEGLKPIMDKFYEAARKLAEVNIPSEITLNAKVAPIEVIITGDVMQQMAPQLQNWIMNAVADQIKQRFNVDGTLRDPSI